MKSRVSKLVSMLCVVSMLISALPVSVFAADEAHTHDAVNAEVYSIGGDTQLKGETGPMKAPALNAAAPVADAAVNPDYVHNFDTQADTINGIYTSIVGKFAGDAKYGLPYTYNGITLSKGLKMESSTSVKFTAPEDGKMILVLSTAGKSVKLDGTKTSISGNVYTWNVTAGSHEVTKDTTNTVLVYMEFQGSCPGHTYTQGKTRVVKAATCTASGTSVKLCDTCGAEGESITVSALGHDWTNGTVSIVTAATCSSKGLKSTKCARCDETRTEEIPATGEHNFSGGVCTVCSMRESDKDACGGSHTMAAGTGKPATCTEAGFTAETCSVCGMTVKTPVPAKGHDWTGTWTVSKPATCTAKGEESLACKNGCGEKQTRETNTIPHTDRNNDGNCDVCGNLIGSPLQGAGGWFETIYVETSQFKATDVTEVSWTGAMSGDMGPGNLYQYDMDFLVRTLNGKTRIDIPGLRPGTYALTVKANGTNYTADVEVKAYDRSGYAHWNYTEGVGAYRDDGILKDEAIVLYVTEQNKNTVELEIPGVVSVQGIGNILNSVGQESSENPGHCKRTSGGKTYWGIANGNKNVLKLLADRDIPLVVRIIGNVSSAHPAPKTGWIDGLTAYDSWDYGGSVGDNGNMARMKDCKNITIEGIGPDACVDGWGFHFMASTATPDYGKNFEVRNIAFRNVPEDCIGMEGIQEGGKITAPILHGWVHNCSFYAPSISPCAESDKDGGDGACDFKRGEYFTMDYCYYEGYHKTNLVGSSDDSLQFNITWHHNHYKNCESRGPLGRQANMHIYNCIYEGQTSYAMQTRANCYIVSEYNSFVGSKNSQQVKGGGPIKSFNDVFSGCIDALDGTIVDSMSTPVSSSNKNAGFELNKSLSYIPDMDYHLDRTIGTARQNILAYTGPMKAAAEMVEPEEIEPTVVDVDRKPANPVGLPFDEPLNATTVNVKNGVVKNVVYNISSSNNSALTFGGDSKGQYIVFKVDKTVDITMTPNGSGSISLIDQDGKTVAVDGATAKNCPPGIYFIQPSGQSKGVFKTGKIEHLKITEVAGADVHTHNYVAGDVVKPATCTLQGIQKWVCSCGEFITKPVPMIDHVDSDGDGLCDVCNLNLNNAGPVDPDVPTVEVESVTVTPTSLTIQQGDSVRLTATVFPANATNKRVAYSSSDTKVASVGTSGYVTGNTPGTAVITVMASNNKSATVNVTVTGVSTQTYTFNAVDQGQQTTDNVPVPVGTKVGTNGFFTVIGDGKAVWRTKNKDTDKTTASLQLGSKRSSGMSFTIPAGSTARSVDISFGSTSKTNVSAIVLADASGARMVNAKGTTMSNITGTSGGKATYNNLPAGTYTIYAPKDVDPSEVGLENWADPTNTSDPSNPNLRGARIMTVTVVQATATGTEYKPVTKVTLDKKTLELEVGQQYTLTASLEPADASNTIVDWVSTVPTVARINGGVVRANAAGKTTIRATAYSGVYDECEVTVIPSTSAPVKVTKITILGADRVETDDVITLVADVEPDDATNSDVAWSVNDESIAKINAGGELTGLSDGQVVVTATAQDGSGVTAQKRVTVGLGVKPADKTGLESVIERANSAIDRVTAAEKAEDVTKGAPWATQADIDAFQTAIDAAQAIDNKQGATADEIASATTALTAAMTTFASKVGTGTKDEGGTPTPTEKTYILTGDEVFSKLTPNGKDTSATPHDIYNFAENEKLTNQGTEGFFTIHGGKNKSDGTPGTKIDYSKKTIGDYSGEYRINFNGGVKVAEEAIGFTTNGKATVKVWWIGGSNDAAGRQMAIIDANGTEVAKSSESATQSSDAFVSTLTLANAGTYYLGGSPKKNNIFKVEVVVAETGGTDPNPPTPTVDRSKLDAALADAQKALDEATVSVNGSDIAPDKTWVTEADKAPLQSAIALAGLAFTQDEVDDAVAELKSAMADFAAAHKYGTKIDKPVDPDDPNPPSPPSGGGGGGSSTPAISGTTITVKGKEQTSSTVGQLTDNQASALTSNAAKSGKDIEVTVSASDDATDVELNVSTKALKNMAAKTDVALVVKTPFGDARLPNASLADLGAESAKGVNVTVEKAENGLKVTVTVGGKTVETLDGGVTAVTDASVNGSVAYQVTADGEKLIKLSYVEDGKLYANLPGSGEIVVKDNTKTFRDVEDNWAKPAIDFAASRELFNGVNELDFAPNQAMTRAMLVTVLYRLEGAKSGAVSKFADVPADSWYTEAVAWANAEGIVSGKSATLFAPNDDITREQLATILYRYATKLCGMSELTEDNGMLDDFSDMSAVSDFAVAGMEWCVAEGVIGGRGDNTLAPGGFASRAEVATMLMRFVKAII